MTDVQTPTKAPETSPIASLSDLECSTITVLVELADAATVAVPMRMIPQYRMMQLSASVPSPVPPIRDIAQGGKPVYNYEDAAYIASVGEVNFKRSSLMLAEMIKMDIPGDTLELKAEYIREKFDPIVTDQLVNVIARRREEAKARIITRAETFHG